MQRLKEKFKFRGKVRQSAKAFLVGVCLTLFIMGPLGAADNPRPLFKTIVLTEKREVVGVLTRDLTGDGKHEIIIIGRTGQYPDYRVQLAIHSWQEGTYPTSPQHTYNPAPDEIAFDFADLDQRPGLELALLTAEGLRVRSIFDKPKTPGQKIAPADNLLVRHPMLLEQVQLGRFPHLPMAHKLSPTRQVLVLPGWKTSLVYDPQAGTSYPLAVRVHSLHRVRGPNDVFDLNFSFGSRSWFPKVMLGDFSGDGKKDFFFAWQDELDVFEQQADGSFAEKPTQHYFFAKLPEKSRRKGDSFVNLDVLDIDNNGVADFIINTYRGRITNVKSTSEVVLRFKDGTTKNLAIPVPQGKIAGALFNDLNNDQMHDLIVVSAKVGVVSIVRALLTGKIYIRFTITPFEPGLAYAGKPRFNRRISFSFDLSSFELRGFVPILRGDFDGDGNKDAIYATSDQQVTVDLFRDKDFFNSELALTYRAETSERLLVNDFDGDGRSDVLFYYGDEKRMGQVSLLINNGIRARSKPATRRKF